MKYRVRQVSKVTYLIEYKVLWWWEYYCETQNKEYALLTCKELNEENNFDSVIIECE